MGNQYLSFGPRDGRGRFRREIFIGILLLASLASTAPAQENTPWSPVIHMFAPPNWINDPNGPILVDGQYNVFFQYNPFGDQWGHMSWGHAVSTDLAHWKQLPVAIPEENGVMIFSGSTVEDRDNTSGLCGTAGQKTPGCLVAIYTGRTRGKSNQQSPRRRKADAEHRSQQGCRKNLDQIFRESRARSGPERFSRSQSDLACAHPELGDGGCPS